jgi:phospholipase/carboxylesterase
MARRLADKRTGPEKPHSVVVFLHGYGADGADLLGLAEPLQPHLPGTAFRAPDAPDRCAGNPYGFQWFPIPWLDGSSPVAMATAFAAARADLNAYLDRVLAEEGLAANRLALFGFSQGTMMALAVAPERPEPLACVVGFSGRLVDRTAPAAARSKLPVMLLHGDADPMVPFESLAEAEAALGAAGFPVETFVMEGTGHGIAPDGLGRALGFLGRHLGG